MKLRRMLKILAIVSGCAIAIAVIMVRPRWTSSEDQVPPEHLSVLNSVYVCAIVGDEKKVKNWVGHDYETLIVFGVASRGVFEIRSLRVDRGKALQRIKLLAKEHPLKILYPWE